MSKTVSLELANKLHKAGIEILCEYAWYECYPNKPKYQVKNIANTNYPYLRKAPDTYELLKQFDKKLCVSVQYGGGIKDFTAGFVDVIKETMLERGIVFFEGDTPAEALGELLLFVKEQEKNT